MPFDIVRDDLLDIAADALVLPSNEELRIDGGAGLRVARAAGLQDVQGACDRIGGCPAGSAVATPAFGLPARTLIHAVGPIWHGGNAGERALLTSTYDAALTLAAGEGCASVALPLIGAGSFGWPAGDALDIATASIRAFLDEHDDVSVTLVVYDEDAFDAASDRFARIRSFIAAAPAPEGDSPWAMGASAPDADFSQPREGGWARQKAPMPGSWGSMAPRPNASMAPASAPRPNASMAPASGKRGRGLDISAPDLSAPVRKVRELGGKLKRKSRAADSAPEPLEEAAREAAPREEEDWLREEAARAAAPWEEEALPLASFEPLDAMPMGSATPLRSAAPMGSAAPRDLNAWLSHLDEGFTTTLLAIIDRKGLKDADVYKRANVSRQLFSKMRSDANYKPTKRTAVALCIALELDLAETQDLLSRAGLTLNRVDTFDAIVQYHILNGIYDIFTINEALFAFDCMLLG